MRQLISRVTNHPLIAERPMVKQFFKFGLVGAMNTAIDLGVYLLLHTAFGMMYLLANIFAFLVGATNSYIFNRRWTFRSTAANRNVEMMKFFIVLGIGFGINEGLLYILVAKFGLGSTIAKLPVIVIVLFWNFFASRVFVFRGTSASLPG